MAKWTNHNKVQREIKANQISKKQLIQDENNKREIEIPNFEVNWDLGQNYQENVTNYTKAVNIHSENFIYRETNFKTILEPYYAIVCNPTEQRPMFRAKTLVYKTLEAALEILDDYLNDRINYAIYRLNYVTVEFEDNQIFTDCNCIGELVQL